jgi:cell division protein FtsB
MRDELNDHYQSFPERYIGLSWKKLILILALLVGLGFYINLLLFGNNSLNVLMQLEAYEAYLKSDVESLKEENAKLQKEYFELKELRPVSTGN